jgi:putative acetyltransferase
MSEGVIIREAVDEDAGEIAGLIAGVFAEYPGCVMDLEGECPDLLTPASYYRARGGCFWVAARGGILATAACEAGVNPHVFAIERLYVRATARKQGLARNLCQRVEDFARAKGGRVIDCWSDTRFLDAHRLYEEIGYQRQNETRALHDLSNSIEFHFIKRLAAS